MNDIESLEPGDIAGIVVSFESGHVGLVRVRGDLTDLINALTLINDIGATTVLDIVRPTTKEMPDERRRECN